MYGILRKPKCRILPKKCRTIRELCKSNVMLKSVLNAKSLMLCSKLNHFQVLTQFSLVKILLRYKFRIKFWFVIVVETKTNKIINKDENIHK